MENTNASKNQSTRRQAQCLPTRRSLSKSYKTHPARGLWKLNRNNQSPRVASKDRARDEQTDNHGEEKRPNTGAKLMDLERLNALKNRVNDLSEASQVAEYKAIIRMVGDLYKEQVAGVLSASTSPTLAQERADAEADIQALINEMNFATGNVKK
jgi:hypothetical protein